MVTENENLSRGERLQIMLAPEELKAVDDFRFKTRMPSRAAALPRVRHGCHWRPTTICATWRPSARIPTQCCASTAA